MPADILRGHAVRKWAPASPRPSCLVGHPSADALSGASLAIVAPAVRVAVASPGVAVAKACAIVAGGVGESGLACLNKLLVLLLLGGLHLLVALLFSLHQFLVLGLLGLHHGLVGLARLLHVLHRRVCVAVAVAIGARVEHASGSVWVGAVGR